MTTIAYREGGIAADTGAGYGGVQLARVTKIVKNDAGAVAGSSGDATWAQAFLAWFKGGEQGAAPVAHDKDKASLGLTVDASGVIRIFESVDGRTISFPIRAPFYAIGSGRSEANGAMFVGASPREAVQAAISLDEGTFGEVETLSVGAEPQKA